jgi:bifunctional DNA-binding transcriptional regulator/antitoxin component of YhaV-PrlF toxin-antitoxin module
MAKVTSKLQVTVPKALAVQYGIRPGDEISWLAAGDAIRVEPPRARPALDLAARLRLFDEATERQRLRERRGRRRARVAKARSRGWTREDLYDRQLPR